jgi:hypothetical protein
MTVSLPNPSSRLRRAAMAEQADLARHRARLGRERDRLLGELRALDDALAEVNRRLDVLAEFCGADVTPRTEVGGADVTPRTELRGAELAARADSNSAEPDTRPALSGPAIREAAVRVLLAQREPLDALHYRRWYELLVEAGYRVAGKDPLAVFLTQLSRSPLVRKTSRPGVYEVDRQAPVRIRHRLERLQAELREVTGAAQSPVELSAVRARRHELDLAISQQERALEEALRVLPGGDANAGSAGAARVG